ncbi:MAG: hypothetical protein B7Z71_12520, partial [Acidocella sp. 21-58-7]
MVVNMLCPCGSGLRQIRCCALDLSTLSPPAATAALNPLLAQAEALVKADDAPGALAVLLQFL